MFKELSKYLDKVNLIITVQAADEGKIRYSITPKAKDGKDMGVVPLVGKGTAEELDEQMPAIIEKAFGANEETIANIVEFTEALKKKAEADKAALSAKKSTSSSTSSTKTEAKKEPEKPKVVNSSVLKGAEKKAWEVAQKLLKDAQGKTDPDMIDYLEKQAVAEALKVKSQAIAVDEIKKNFQDVRDNLTKKKMDDEKPEEGLFTNASVEQPSAETTKLIEEVKKEGKEVTIADVNEKKAEKKKAEPKPPPPTAEQVDPFGGSVDISETTDDDDDINEDDEDEDDANEDIVNTTDDEEESETVTAAADPDEIDIF